MKNLRTYEEWDWSNWPWTGKDTTQRGGYVGGEPEKGKTPRPPRPDVTIPPLRKKPVTGGPLKELEIKEAGINIKDYHRFQDNLEYYDMLALTNYSGDDDCYFIKVLSGLPHRKPIKEFTIKYFTDTNYVIVEYEESGNILRRKKLSNLIAAYDFILNDLEDIMTKKKKIAREYESSSVKKFEELNLSKWSLSKSKQEGDELISNLIETIKKDNIKIKSIHFPVSGCDDFTFSIDKVKYEVGKDLLTIIDKTKKKDEDLVISTKYYREIKKLWKSQKKTN